MRAPRQRAADATFHVTTHGVDDRPIFLDDIDRQTFVNRVGHIKRRLGWTIYALCLMTTHYHVVLSLRDDNLSAGMMVINGAHARLFNKRHDRRGPVFEERYHSTLIEDDAHLETAIRYIALNPVRAGIVKHPADWPWCFVFGSVEQVPGTAVPGTH